MEFKEHVARLANGGDPIAAYKCWMRGVEILQSPFFVPTTSELEELPPTLEALCSQHPCHHTLAASSSCDGAEVSLFRQGHGPGNGWDHHRWTRCAGSTVGSPVEAPDVAPLFVVWAVVWKDWNLCFPPRGDPGSRVFKCRWPLA